MKFKKDILFLLLLLILVLLFLNRGVRMEGVFFGADEVASDILHFSYPYHEYWAAEFLKHGVIGVWNPYLGSGLPLLAEAQTGMFYPLSVLLYFFLPAPVAFNYLIISCFLLVAIGTYLYARMIGMIPIAAFFSAVVFVLSGYMVGHLRHVPIITAMAVMPLLFLFVEKLLESYKLFWALLLAGCIAISFFAGHLTTTYIMVLFLIPYFFLRLQGSFQEKKKESIKPILLFGFAIILGIGIAAIQLLPALELIQYSTRATAADTQHVGGAGYNLKNLLLFFNPYLFGDPSRGTWNMGAENYWENIGYIGIIPLLLGLGGVVFAFTKKGVVKKSFVAMLLFAFVMLLGDQSFVYKLFQDWIPGFSFTRISGRYLLFVDFFLAIIAGFFLMYLYNKLKASMRNKVMIALFAITLLDLFLFGYFFNTVLPLSYFSKPATVAYLENRKDTELFRVKTADSFGESWVKAWELSHGWRGDLSAYAAQREYLAPDLNLLYRISSPSLIYGLSGHFSVRRSNELDAVVFDALQGKNPKQLARLFGMENVKYLISPIKMPNVEGLQLIAELPTGKKEFKTFLYKNDYFLPRAYLVGKSTSFENSQDLLETMLFKNFDPAKEVLLEGATRKLNTSGKGVVQMQSYKPTEITMHVRAVEDAVLVLSDTYYPGWKAYIDNKEVPIVKANYAYRAIFVPKGDHNVSFRYESAIIKFGAALSLFSLALVIFLLVVFRTKSP